MKESADWVWVAVRKPIRSVPASHTGGNILSWWPAVLIRPDTGHMVDWGSAHWTAGLQRRSTLCKLSILLSEYDRLTPTLHHCNEGPPPAQIFQGKSEHPSSSKINPAWLFKIFSRTTLAWVAGEHMKTYYQQSITPRLFVQILLSSAFLVSIFAKIFYFYNYFIVSSQHFNHNHRHIWNNNKNIRLQTNEIQHCTCLHYHKELWIKKVGKNSFLFQTSPTIF